MNPNNDHQTMQTYDSIRQTLETGVLQQRAQQRTDRATTHDQGAHSGATSVHQSPTTVEFEARWAAMQRDAAQELHGELEAGSSGRPPLDSSFDALDINGDGVIDRAEFEAAMSGPRGVGCSGLGCLILRMHSNADLTCC